jgi:hypothetical protein
MFRTVWGALQPAPCRVEASAPDVPLAYTRGSETLILSRDRKGAVGRRIITVVLLAPLVSFAQPSSDALKQLASKILAQLHSPVSLTFENRSTLAAVDADAIRAPLEEQLRAGGLALGDSETKLRVILSEDPARYLLIAQSGAQVSIVNWKKPPAAAPEYRVSIKHNAVWEQRDPILDVALPNGGASLFVLETDRMVQYSKSEGQWRIEKPSSLTLSRPMPRDPRGRLAGSPPSPDVPGLNGPNPLRWVPGRDYFDGGERGLYFTAAQISDGALLAGIDGHTRFFNGRSEVVLTIDNWGSDIAAISSSCGSRKQVLATSPATDGAADHIQAFEFAGAAYAAVSEPLPLPGPVTALWPAESPDQVTLVVHNRQTGVYEASRISLSCTQ